MFGERDAAVSCHDLLVFEYAGHASMGHMPADAGEAACKADYCYSSQR